MESQGQPEPAGGEITVLLRRSASGDRDAFHSLIPLVYGDLKGIAHRRLKRERSGHTLNTTAIVHEAYLNLVPQATAEWKDRVHFFAVAARVIRHLLIDYARHKSAEKRGGSAIRVPLREDVAGGKEPNTVDLLTLGSVLDALAERDPQLRDVVDCRFFAGMTMEETAEALDLSKRSAERAWTRARTYLYQALSD
jgi:RNA polymerase sigma factor (TIGR02999 family)